MYTYVIAMSNVFKEDVIVAKYYNDDADPPVKFDENGLLWVRVLKDRTDPKGFFSNEIESLGLKELGKREAEINESVKDDDCEWVPIKAAFS